MNLAGLFGDDQSGQSADIYVRTMRCRKWVVFAAVGYYLTHATLFSPQPFSVFVGRTIVDLATLRAVTKAGLSYITLMYGLLLLQLAFRYSSILAERFGLREHERVMRTQAEIQALEDQLSQLDRRPTRDSSYHSQRSTITDRITVLNERIDGIDPGERPHASYRVSETLQDLMRMASPIAAGIAVLIASI
jgi:hypothetical protein